jgi:hypothetical protein
VALAKLILRPAKRAASFELATREPGDSGQFIVGSGMASFMDEVTRTAFARLLADYYAQHPSGNYYTDVLEREFKRSAANRDDPLEAGLWNIHRIPRTQSKIAMFASGLGDGGYRSWWGLGPDGEVVSLITDFGLLG